MSKAVAGTPKGCRSHKRWLAGGGGVEGRRLLRQLPRNGVPFWATGTLGSQGTPISNTSWLCFILALTHASYVYTCT